MCVPYRWWQHSGSYNSALFTLSEASWTWSEPSSSDTPRSGVWGILQCTVPFYFLQCFLLREVKSQGGYGKALHTFHLQLIVSLCVGSFGDWIEMQAWAQKRMKIWQISKGKIPQHVIRPGKDTGFDCWTSSRVVLMWDCTETIMGLLWDYTGLFWDCTKTVLRHNTETRLKLNSDCIETNEMKLKQYWDHTERMLSPCWDNAKSTLKQCLAFTETTLKLCWDNAKVTLRLMS